MKQALYVLLVSATALAGCASPLFRSVINPIETSSLAAAEIARLWTAVERSLEAINNAHAASAGTMHGVAA